jgi:hypothetical protein
LLATKNQSRLCHSFDGPFLWHYVIVPNVTIPKLVKIPNINRNPAIPPPNLVPFLLT